MKAAHIVSLAAVTLALAACGTSPMPHGASLTLAPGSGHPASYAALGTKTQGDFNLAHARVSLAIDGAAVAGLRQAVVPDAKHAHDAHGDATDAARAADGAKIIMDRDTGRSKLMVESGSEAAKVMQAWRRAVLDGKVDRKSVSLIFHNDANEEVARMTLFEAWPTKWVAPALNARNSGHATEAIEISWERMELK